MQCMQRQHYMPLRPCLVKCEWTGGMHEECCSSDDAVCNSALATTGSPELPLNSLGDIDSHHLVHQHILA